MKVFDCFTFFNEIDLLKFRLEYLSDVVDYHVIVESNLTHNGNPKPFYFNERMEEFSQWSHKILYVPIEQSTDGLVFDKVDSYSPGNGSWLLENQHRDAIAYVKDLLPYDDMDLFMISDLDEIPRPDAIQYVKDTLGATDMVALSMLFHYYYMNCQNVGFEREWKGTVAVRGQSFKYSTPQDFRNLRNHINYINNAGFHFSFLGGVEKIRTKIQSFAHTEFNRPDIVSDENIVAALEKGEDIFKRPGVSYRFVDVNEYPEDIRKIMLKYPQFIKQL